jgi:hypothetical protein
MIKDFYFIFGLEPNFATIDPCIHGSSPFQQMINPEAQLHTDVRKI